MPQGEPVKDKPGWFRFSVRVRGQGQRVTKKEINARVSGVARKGSYPKDAVRVAKGIAWRAIVDGKSPEQAVALAVRHLRSSSSKRK